MPFVRIKASVPISREQEIRIRKAAGQAIAMIPGKSEAYLLLVMEDMCRIWLRGEEVPCAYIEASLFGSEHHIGYDRFSSALTETICEVLDIPSENIYIRFDDIGTWSCGGQLIERRMI